LLRSNRGPAPEQLVASRGNGSNEEFGVWGRGVWSQQSRPALAPTPNSTGGSVRYQFHSLIILVPVPRYPQRLPGLDTILLAINEGHRFRAKIDQHITFYGLWPASPGHNLALAVLYVPCSLDSGGARPIRSPETGANPLPRPPARRIKRQLTEEVVNFGDKYPQMAPRPHM